MYVKMPQDLFQKLQQGHGQITFISFCNLYYREQKATYDDFVSYSYFVVFVKPKLYRNRKRDQEELTQRAKYLF